MTDQSLNLLKLKQLDGKGLSSKFLLFGIVYFSSSVTKWIIDHVLTLEIFILMIFGMYKHYFISICTKNLQFNV